MVEKLINACITASHISQFRAAIEETKGKTKYWELPYVLRQNQDDQREFYKEMMSISVGDFFDAYYTDHQSRRKAVLDRILEDIQEK